MTTEEITPTTEETKPAFVTAADEKLIEVALADFEDVPTDVALSLGRKICRIAADRKRVARERAIITDVHRECLDRLAQLTQLETDLNAQLAEALA